MDETGNSQDKLAAFNAKLGDRIVIDPASIGDAGTGSDDGAGNHSGPGFNKDGSVRKRRGRKPGTKNTGKSEKGTSSVKGIEKILLSAHMMAASFFKTPEIMLDNQEAELLASAIGSVQDFYNFETSAEVMLWINVVGVVGAVYGPRILAIAAKGKKKAEKKEAPDNASNASQVIEGFFTTHHAPTE